MNLSALKTKVPAPWTNAGLAPLIALALIAGARAGPGGPGGTAHHGSGGPGHHNGSGGTDSGERHPSSTSHSPLRTPQGVPISSNPASTVGLGPVGVPSFTTGQFSIPPFLLPIYE